jgi:hypothetical protein
VAVDTAGRITDRTRATTRPRRCAIANEPAYPAPEAPGGPSPVWLAVTLVLFALVSVTVGVVARESDPASAPGDYFKLFFSDPLHLKVWFATVAFVLACTQLVTAARVYGVIDFPPRGRFFNVVHRWSGRLAVLFTLPVAYHCIFMLGFGDYTDRVYVHSLLGSVVYGAVVAKVLIVRGGNRFPGWFLPIAGGLLFSILLGLWLTSSLWFFNDQGVEF